METLVQKGQDAWNKVLGRIDVEGGTLDQYRTFYSCSVSYTHLDVYKRQEHMLRGIVV